jgi:hypothetical protein
MNKRLKGEVKMKTRVTRTNIKRELMKSVVDPKDNVPLNAAIDAAKYHPEYLSCRAIEMIHYGNIDEAIMLLATYKIIKPQQG